MSNPTHSRWRWLAGAAVGALVLASAVTAVGAAQGGADQPTPGPVSTDPEPVVTQADPGPAATSGYTSPEQLVTQTPSTDPDLSGAPTQVVGPEVEGAGRPSESGEVETAVVGQPD